MVNVFEFLGLIALLWGMAVGSQVSRNAENELGISKEELYTRLKEDLYCPIPFGIPLEFYQNAIESFIKYHQLPNEFTSKITTKLNQKHRRGDLGLVIRSDVDGSGLNDDKVFFHYHPILHSLIEEDMENYQVVREFFDKARVIWEAVEKKLDKVLSIFEQDFPSCKALIFPKQSTQNIHIVLRFLEYRPKKKGILIAKPHYDAGTLTFALAESSPGLHIGVDDKSLKLVQYQEEAALLFLAANHKRLFVPNQKLVELGFQPAWHNAILQQSQAQSAEEESESSFSRWAIVAFVDGFDFESPSKKETLRRTHANE